MTEVMTLDAPSTPARLESHYRMKHVFRSETAKITTLRSNLWILLVTVAGSLLVDWLAMRGQLGHSADWYQGFDPTNQSLAGLLVATLTVGVFGVLAVTAEYGSGTIRTTLSAVPRRTMLVQAKALVVGSATVIVGEVLAFGCFWLGQAMLSGHHDPSAHLFQPGVFRAITLTGAFLALLALMGMILGLIFRSTAGGIAGYVGATLLLPLILRAVPGDPNRYTPIGLISNSVSSTMKQSPNQVPALLGFGLMVGYCVALYAVGLVLMTRRDA